MTQRLDPEAFIVMYETFMDAKLDSLERHEGNLRESYIPQKERAKLYQKNLTRLGLRKFVSVTLSGYSWINIKSDTPDWETFRDESYDDIQHMMADINDKLEAIWHVTFPGIRNIIDSQSDYFNMAYSIN